MQQSNSPIRVLLVEDEPTQMELTRETLLDADPTLDITTVELSSNALQLLGYLEFDCIVSDYQMPEMNGIVFCRKIRETSDIPFILYTGRGSDEVAFAAFEAGVNDYVRKEKELAHYGVLARRIRHAVEKHKSDKSLREREDQIIGIFESITDGFVSLDEDWKYSYVNSAAEKGLKTFKENLIGKVLWDYWPELPEEFRDALVEAALTNTPRRAEFYYPFLDSWFQINSYPSETGVNVYFQNITERKTAELEQIKNKEKAELEKTQLQTVLETTPSAVVLLDSNGEFIYANNRALELYGFDTVGIDLETHLDKVKVLKPDGSPFPRWEIPESRSLRGLTVRNEELTIERADGRQIPVLVSSAPIYNNEGKLASAVVIFEEITDLKKMEHELGARNIELRKSLDNAKRIASEFEQIYNTAPGAMCVFDTDLRYVRVNKLMAEINGHTVGEHIGKTVWDIVPDLAETAEKISKDIFESGEPVLNIEFNGEVASTPGVIRTWLENWHPVREGERIVGINVVAQEITDLKRAENRLIDTLDEISSSYEELAAVEEELRTSNEELRLQTLKLRESEDSLKEYADNLEHLVEERTSQLRRSEEMLRSFMDSAPDMFWLYSPDLRLLDVNKKGLELLGLEKEAALGKKLEEIVPGIESEERYLLFKKVLETGEPIHIETYQPVEKFGDLWVSVWAFKSGNNLGLISRDITSQKVAEERFRRSKQFEAVSSIGATIAHDLRNPLSRTNQAIELARRKPNTTERMLDIAQESAQYALNMVEEFREGTRWIKPKKQKVNLKKLVSESIGSVKMPDRVKLTVDMAASVGMVMVDPEVLQRVIVNLVLNGIEAMPYGGWLNISINRRDSFVSIAVSDTGVGMSHEVLKKIWQPLFTTKSKGIGLGLYFVRNAIDAHGGDINITTGPGKGTTFTINIPDSIE